MDDLLIIFGLILLNGIFSMSEVSLISARKSKLSSDAARGNKNAAIALSLQNNPERFLSTIQIGITLIGILTGLFSGATVAAELGTKMSEWGVKPSVAMTLSKVVIVAFVTYLSIVIGELVPKRIGMNMSDRMAKMMAPVMKVLSFIAYPLVWLLSVSTTAISRLLRINTQKSTVTEEEIKSLIREGTEAGEVKEVEEDIMSRVLVMGDLKVQSIMTVRGDVMSLASDMTVDEVRDVLQSELHTSYPVFNPDKTEVVGVISLKQLVFSLCDGDFNLSKMLGKALYIPENMSVYDALETFKANRVHSAIVCDEYGDFCGVVTLRDVLDGLIGSCPGIAEESMIVRTADKDEWVVSGQCTVYDFLAYFDREDLYSSQEFTTVGGMIMNHLRRIPAGGDVMEWHGFRLEVVNMDMARVDKVAVTAPNISGD